MFNPLVMLNKTFKKSIKEKEN